METYTAFDTVDDHYQVVSVGWEGSQRLHGCLIHVDIKEDKIWIQYDCDCLSFTICQEIHRICRRIKQYDLEAEEIIDHSVTKVLVAGLEGFME
jgi:hypothetical protein